MFFLVALCAAPTAAHATGKNSWLGIPALLSGIWHTIEKASDDNAAMNQVTIDCTKAAGNTVKETTLGTIEGVRLAGSIIKDLVTTNVNNLSLVKEKRALYNNISNIPQKAIDAWNNDMQEDQSDNTEHSDLQEQEYESVSEFLKGGIRLLATDLEKSTSTAVNSLADALHEQRTAAKQAIKDTTKVALYSTVNGVKAAAKETATSAMQQACYVGSVAKNYVNTIPEVAFMTQTPSAQCTKKVTRKIIHVAQNPKQVSE